MHRSFASTSFTCLTPAHMVRNATLSTFILLSSALLAQTHNALDFDGLDDQVVVSNASAGIANAAGITLSCWVYPTNAAPNYPDFDGFAGFRNEFNADFYLLQISPYTTVEGRFRNSNDEAFTVTMDNLTLNEWQYLTLVYDGTDLTIYRNGVQAASTPANGAITSTTEAFHIGNVPFTSADFLLTGRADEVALWSRALNANEIACAMHDVAADDDGLQLYYKCDQGTAGGSNSAVGSLADASGHLSGTLNNFALTGATSNFVDGVGFGGGTTVASICPGGSYTFHSQEITTPGTYQVVLGSNGGCDSLATLVLGQTNVNVNVIQAGNSLTSTAATGPYQWLDCGNNYAPVPGATNQSFTPTVSGSYALRRTNGSCADTSNCYTVTIVGIEEVAGLIAGVSPSPATDRLNVTLKQPADAALLRVLDLGGREVMRVGVNGRRTVVLDVASLAPGAYVLQLQGSGVHGAVRFAKQ